MKKIIRFVSIQFFLVWRFFRVIFPEWFAEHCPVHIPTKRPKCPNHICDSCGKPRKDICAINTGDGFVLFWECEDRCGDGDGEDDLVGWWPFWFGAWTDYESLRKIGIEEV